ncbi:MAG: cation:proton antiporter [Candidatus Caenarcaniphilales bacterium]|nr:cation:proton antiporter [Candidatus Caenarcaniphilales bacterium]
MPEDSNQHLNLLLLGLTVLLGFAKSLALVLRRLKLPEVVGELSGGILLSLIAALLPVGNFLHDLIDTLKHSEILHLFGEIGILLLLFEIGLETELSKIVAVGREAFLVALGGVVAPFLLAWLLSFFLHWSVNLTLLVGLVFAATSIGITARVFKDLKALHTIDARVVLGAAVIDDVIGFILLSVIFSLVTEVGSSFNLLSFGLIFVKTSLFFACIVLLANFTSNQTWLQRMGRNDPLNFLVIVLIFCFGMSYIASLIGIAPIIGAFAAGTMLDKVKITSLLDQKEKVEDFVAPLRAFLAPLFFAMVGLAVEPAYLFSPLVLVFTLVAVLTKLASSWIFLPFKTGIDRLLVGVGMIPRGEVGLIVVAMGGSYGLIDGELQTCLLGAVIATTLIAPLWLQFLLKSKK